MSVSTGLRNRHAKWYGYRHLTEFGWCVNNHIDFDIFTQVAVVAIIALLITGLQLLSANEASMVLPFKKLAVGRMNGKILKTAKLICRAL